MSNEPSARWSVEPCSYVETSALVRELGLTETVASILVRRGLGDPVAARRFLDASDRHDPFEIDGMREAVAVILEHVRAGHTIALHGDYDVDGVSSTALMVRTLRDLGADVMPRLPSRQEDGYGLSITTVEQLHRAGASLLVTTDCGVGAVEQVARARELGMDVVVTDHHRPGDVLPDCPIVHPAIGGYPCPELCATGVAYKLSQALFTEAGRDPAELERELDIVALATVADVMPLLDENRALVRDGLRVVAGAGRPGVRALLRVAGVDPQSATEHTFSFVMGPRINAAGRLYRADAALELLLTDDEDRAFEIARELDGINRERQSVETEILFEAERQLSESGQKDQSAFVLAGEGWHSGVIGIVASRMVERYHRPCVMIALDGQGRGKGSARSISAYDLHGGLGACSEHLVRYGGHRMAAGLEIDAANVDAFRAALVEHAQEQIAAEDLVRVERVDAVVPGDQLTLELAEQLETLRPFGMGNPTVNLMVPAARISDVQPLGKEKKHSKFTVTSGGVRARVVAFGAGERPAGLGRAAADETRFDVVARLERNEWQGSVEPQLILRSLYEVDSPQPSPAMAGPGWWKQVWREFDGAQPPGVTGPPRELLDRRGSGVFGALGALLSTGESVAIATADVTRRRVALDQQLGLERFGGATVGLIDHQSLLHDPASLGGFTHLFLLDPPSHAQALEALCATGPGFVHLAWGSSEVEFAVRALEAGYAVREPMRAIYAQIAANPAGLADRALEQVLLGSGTHPRSPALVGRCLRVLDELGLVGIERSSGTVRCTITHPQTKGQRVELESSKSFSTYARTCREGIEFLNEQISRSSQRQAA